jgi:hypothetical protein
MPDLNRSLLSEAENADTLGGLGDVTLTSTANGQILQYDGSKWINAVDPSGEPIGHENKADSVISFTEGTRTFSIAPASTSYIVWCKGVRYVKNSTETVQIPDASGLYYIYFSSTGVLSYKTTYFDWENDTPTAYIYWNATDDKAYFFADERHGVTLDWATHEYLHRTRGAAIANGFGISWAAGDGSSDTDAKFDLANGTFFDEDLQVDVTHSATPIANTWEQTLQGNAEIPSFYRDGDHWKKDAATEFAFKQGSGRPKYNLYSGGAWTTATAQNGYYIISWIVATNNLNEPILSIMGQTAYVNQGLAEEALWEDLDLSALPIHEFRPLHKIIYKALDTYTNSVNARIVLVTDIRQILSTDGAIPSTPVSDHGSMTGLSDDDHTQYILVDGTRNANTLTITNDLTVGGNLTVNGETTTLNTANLNVEDNFIIVNSGVTGSPSLNAGIEVERGDSTNVAIRWNETSDKWQFTTDGTNYTDLGAGGATISDTAPASPVAGQVWFESDTASTYVYYDSHWIEIGASGTVAYVGDTAPSSPIPGQFWYDSSDGGTYVYYDSVWVEVGALAINSLLSIINAKGDLLVGTADNTLNRLAVGTNGYFLKANSSATTGLEWASIPTINALDDIGDVTITTISTGQFLKWDGSAWVNATIPTINALDDVGDVTITSASSGQVLQWNGSAWINATVSSDVMTDAKNAALIIMDIGA